MINEEKLTKLYEGVLTKNELTTKDLNSYGFNSNEITKLIEQGVVERIKRGSYSFTAIGDLSLYGKKLNSLKEYDLAIACFEKCLEIDPNYYFANFYLFFDNVMKGNYELAFRYFKVFYNLKGSNIHNHNYYLYLLSMVMELPAEYREVAKKLTINDIKIGVHDGYYNNDPIQNKIRILSLNHRFRVAISELDRFINRVERNSIQSRITKRLLIEASFVQREEKEIMMQLIQTKKYEEVIKFVEKIQEQHNLSMSNRVILNLTKELLEIKRTGVIPQKEIIDTNYLFEAIAGKNYELALKLCKEPQKVQKESNVLYLLLTEITSLIDSLKEKQKIKEPTKSSDFADVVGYLMNKDFENAFATLRNYLRVIGKAQYEFLIINLIKVSIIDEDFSFSKPMIALTNIEKDNFEFNISEYIQEFYLSLSQSNVKKARIYLDIISKSNKLSKSYIATDGLEQALDNLENMADSKQSEEALSKVEESKLAIKDSTPSVIEKTQELDTLPIEEPICQETLPVNETKIIQLSNNNCADVEFINSKLDELYKNGIVLLDPMDVNRRKSIHEIVRDIPDVVSFSIGKGDLKQIVLRHKTHIEEYVNFKKLSNKGRDAYNKKDYDTCIKNYRFLLQIGTPKAYTYVGLGLAYMKKFDIKTAIDYLTVATELSKEEGGKYDFTDLIASLKCPTPSRESKPRTKMKIADFKDDINDYYGINEIEQIAELISSGMTIDEACSSVGLTEEQRVIAVLIFARESYAQSEFDLGDRYLKKAERSEHKTEFVQKLLEDVRKNRLFFKNRVEEGQPRLRLTLKKRI